MIFEIVGARNVDHVKRVLAGKTYRRVLQPARASEGLGSTSEDRITIRYTSSRLNSSHRRSYSCMVRGEPSIHNTKEMICKHHDFGCFGRIIEQHISM